MDLKEAADRLGVHYQTAYRWVRSGSLAACKIGPSYHVTDDEVRRMLAARLAPAPPPIRTTVRDWDAQADRLHRALVSGDEMAARAVVLRIASGGQEPLAICRQLVSPALARIGTDWAAGRLSIAHEHRAAAICQRLLACIAVDPRGRPRGVAVVGTPPSEQHGLPATMAAVVLRADRWRVHHLAPNVPADDLLALADEVGADIIVLSATMPHAVAEAHRIAGETGRRTLVGSPGACLTQLVTLART